MVAVVMVFGNPEFCSNSKCDVNKDEEGKQLPSSTSVHPDPHLGIRTWSSYFPTKDPNHEEVDEDVEDGKDEEPMVQLLKTTAAA